MGGMGGVGTVWTSYSSFLSNPTGKRQLTQPGRLLSKEMRVSVPVCTLGPGWLPSHKSHHWTSPFWASRE